MEINFRKNQMKHQWKPLLLVACIFLFTGSLICMNDILLPSLKDLFKLSYVQATFIQQSFFLVYLIFPIPIAWYISRYGYKTSVVTALTVCGCGCMLFLPAYYFLSYTVALIAIFIVSTGIAMINVAANPLAALLGHSSGSHVRVNIVQLFSRIGYSFTPVIGTGLIYGNNNSISFHLPYLVLGIGTFLFAIFILFSALPSLKPDVLKDFSLLSIVKGSRKYPQLFWGAIIMFFYMGAEAGTAGFFINYLRDNSVAGFSAEKAAQFLTYYYIASTVFCIAGIYLLQFVSPGRLLAVFGVCMVILYLLAALTTSKWNPYYLVGLGAFISVMFPCIFSLGIEGVGSFTEKGSALINMAVVGGAVFPPLQGMIADSKGVQLSYLIPCFCVILIILYGIFCDFRVNADKKLSTIRDITRV
jgi:MFS transporter, FHS family, L-fucose permease